MNSAQLFPVSLPPPSTLLPCTLLSPVSLPPVLPDIAPPPTNPINNLSEEAKIEASILFPQTKALEANLPLNHTQTHTLTASPVDYELETLKNSILSQSPNSSLYSPISMQKALNIIEPFVTTDLHTKLQGNLKQIRGCRCSAAERMIKIRKYKEKQRKWRERHPVSRSFDGRRKVAFNKKRINGRFAKGYIKA